MDNKLKREKKKTPKETREFIIRGEKKNEAWKHLSLRKLSVVLDLCHKIYTFVCAYICFGDRNWQSKLCTQNRSKYSICVPIWKKRCTFFIELRKKPHGLKANLVIIKKMFLGLCMQTLEIGGSLKHFIWHFFMTLIFFYCRA